MSKDWLLAHRECSQEVAPSTGTEATYQHAPGTKSERAGPETDKTQELRTPRPRQYSSCTRLGWTLETSPATHFLGGSSVPSLPDATEEKKAAKKKRGLKGREEASRRGRIS